MTEQRGAPSADDRWLRLPDVCAQLCRREGNGRTRFIVWPRRDAPRAEDAAWLPLAGYRMDAMPLYTSIVPDHDIRQWLPGTRGKWMSRRQLRDGSGDPVASVWESEKGDVFLPFDPNEAIHNYWSEAYQAAGAPQIARLKQAATRGYYRLRPFIPRAGQICFRRLLSRFQRRTRFPRWPVETCLHELYTFLFRVAAAVAREPVPWIAPWPRGYRWALVMTHDVETSVGYENLGRLRAIEDENGFRSSWNFVPRRYEVDDETIRDLAEGGFEVGVHGLYHDGRDLESLALLQERLPEIRRYAERWHAVGFRAPATQRAWDLVPVLGFEYDSSYPDTDPFEPQPGGCCTWLPFFNGSVVELPITLPQDHTLFVILRQTDGSLWEEKASFLREQGGLALLITHPDYMLGSERLAAYDRFLKEFRRDEEMWRALPRDLAAWWRERAASRIERNANGWRIAGPAVHRGDIVFFPNGR